MPVSLAKRSLPLQLLDWVIEAPHMVEAVRALPARTLGRWIDRVGLEDAGPLLAMARSEQLEALLDQDVWRSTRRGHDEVFDAERFVLWLEVLLDVSTAAALRAVRQMDEDLLTLALCRNLFVIDVELLAQHMSSGAFDDDADLVLKELDGALYQELAQYRVLSRNARTFEPLRTLLVELDSEDPELASSLLARCCHISTEYIDDHGGLYEVLSSDEMLEADAAGEREQRRAKQGFVAPSMATSFLRHAEQTELAQLIDGEAVDPITHAYFREVETTAAGEVMSDLAPELRQMLQTLEPAKRLPSRERHALLRAMRALREDDERTYARRLEELAYLANVLLARDPGASPDALAERALALCERGATVLRAQDLRPLLARTSLVKLFRIGWHITHVR